MLQIFAKKSKKCGFTLIEILVVLAIIGLLTGLVFTATNKARSRARDARRMSDMRQVFTAQEMYKSNKEFYFTSPEADFIPAIGDYLPEIKDPQDPTKTYQWLANTDCYDKFCAYATLEGTTTCLTVEYFAASEEGVKAVCSIPSEGCLCY